MCGHVHITCLVHASATTPPKNPDPENQPQVHVDPPLDPEEMNAMDDPAMDPELNLPTDTPPLDPKMNLPQGPDSMEVPPSEPEMNPHPDTMDDPPRDPEMNVPTGPETMNNPPPLSDPVSKSGITAITGR